MATRQDPDPNAEVLPARRVYPWQTWEEGGVWTLSPGEDFDVSPEIMRNYIYTRARSDGFAVSVAVLDDGRVQFQFRLPSEPAVRLPDAPARGRPSGVGAGVGGRVSNSARGRAQRWLQESSAERKAKARQKGEDMWAEFQRGQGG